MKKIYRSSDDRILTGTLGGIAEYFNINPQIVRIIYVIFFLLIGRVIVGIIIYLVCLALMPEATFTDDYFQNGKKNGHRKRKDLKDVKEYDNHK